jgi:hypothetical protein
MNAAEMRFENPFQLSKRSLKRPCRRGARKLCFIDRIEKDGGKPRAFDPAIKPALAVFGLMRLVQGRGAKSLDPEEECLFLSCPDRIDLMLEFYGLSRPRLREKSHRPRLPI